MTGIVSILSGIKGKTIVFQVSWKRNCATESLSVLTDSQQGVDEFPTHGRCAGRIGSSATTKPDQLLTTSIRRRWMRQEMLKDGERLHPKSWSGSTPLRGFAREVAAWLGNDDLKHEAGRFDSAAHAWDAQSNRGVDRWASR